MSALSRSPCCSLALDSWEIATDLGSNKLKFKKGEILLERFVPTSIRSVSPLSMAYVLLTLLSIRPRRPEHFAVVAARVSSDAFVAEASATANGAKMPRANWDVLEKYQVVIPNGQVAAMFSALFTNIVAQQQALIFQIQNLRRTHELLLPRLLSGQIDVEVIPRTMPKTSR